MQKLSNDGRGFYKKIQDKREMTFLFTHDKGLVVKTRDYKEDWEKICADKPVYSLITGEDFLEKIESGCIRDCDGYIANIFVDGYVSNLGIFYKGFSSGGFLADKEVFLNFCERHSVVINWVNR